MMRLALAVLTLALLSGCATTPGGMRAENGENGAEAPRNVILMIGDGMGVSQVTLGSLVAEKTLFADLPVAGLCTTHSADNSVTDSAAAATAFACGVKTNNGWLGRLADEKTDVVALAQDLRAKLRYAFGLVTTTTVTHATPGGFYAHGHRREQEIFANQLLELGKPDVCLGGGRKFFKTKKNEGLLAKYEAAGYRVVTDLEGFQKTGDEPKLLGLFAEEDMAYEIERDKEREPSLTELSKKALAILSKKVESGGAPGFFVMIEGARIDHACHSHDAAASARDTIEFARAVDAALEFAKKDGKTLVVVTADHARGGMAISETIDLAKIRAVKASTERLFSLTQGAGAESWAALVKKHMGVELTEAEVAEVLASTKHGKEYGPVTTAGHIVSAKLGIHFMPLEAHWTHHSTHGHDGAMVPVYAFGPGAEAFAGTIDDTDIPTEMRKFFSAPAKMVGAGSLKE